MDIAALAAAGANDKVAAATLAMVDNGFAVLTEIRGIPGTYTADRNFSIEARFTEGGPSPNATRVMTRSSVVNGFSRVVGEPASMEMMATATAIRADFAAFSIGTRAAAPDGGCVSACNFGSSALSVLRVGGPVRLCRSRLTRHVGRAGAEDQIGRGCTCCA